MYIFGLRMNFHPSDPVDAAADDAELLAELLALQKEEAANNKSNDPNLPQNNEATEKRTSQPAPSTSHDFNSQSNEPLDEEMEDLLDDQDLLNELNELVVPSAAEVSPTKRELQRPSMEKMAEQQAHCQSPNISPKRTKTSTECNKLEKGTVEVPVDPAPAPPLPDRPSNIIPPPIPARNSSLSLPQKDEVISEPSERNVGSLEDRAKSVLLRRRKLYMDRSLAAKQVNDRTAAVEAFETVKLFNQALDAIKKGAQLSEEDFEQIPPSPPPYKTPSHQSHPFNKMSAEGNNGNEKGAIGTKQGQSIASTSKSDIPLSDELKLVITRQQQLKKEALAAKQRGNLEAAKEFLTLAHRMDQMVEAAKCGLPIDIQQIPELQSNLKTLPRAALRNMAMSDGESLRKCKLLEIELLKQIEFCEVGAREFQAASDPKNTVLYEGLLQQTKKDLQRVQLAVLGNAELPTFKLLELSLPVAQLNPAIPDDKLELHIQKIENLKLQEGWKPLDCALYVFYKFPFPHGTHQTGRTSTVKGTNSPEYSNTFQLDIHRKTKQLLRICKRQHLKLEIYQKGGFLRSDKLFANAEVPLQALENSVTISGNYPILEGRKKTGGSIHIVMRISKPLGDGIDATTNIKRKWVKMEN